MSATVQKGGLRVVKLGGSLLDWPEFPAQLRAWLARQTPACHAILTGGGGLADVIRVLDRNHALGEAASHKLCIDVLAVTARILSMVLPEARGPLPPHAIERENRSSLVILDLPKLIELDAQRSARPLPASWDVTADSIAARAAVLLGADELVLLKSALPQRAGSLRGYADAGYVDAHFQVCAKSIGRIRLVSLRDADFAEVVYSTSQPHR